MARELLLATNNPAKLREYRAMLADFQLTTLSEQGIRDSVEEGFKSQEENARLKATTYSALSKLVTLADDSGLEVDALGGEPGPLSARYAGKGASDAERIKYLLQRLEGMPWEKRTARFLCVIAIATPNGKIEICQGECRGVVAFEPKGEYGFGYDPIFYLPELSKTMAELCLEEKNKISHRGQATQKARPILERFLREGEG